jgi:integrase/recombinase XerD
MVGEVARAAGITYKKIHPHTLRHTFATDLLRATKNLRLVQKALGHEWIGTTQIYTHIVDEELEMALKTFRNGAS